MYRDINSKDNTNEEDFPNEESFFFSRVHPEDVQQLSDSYEKALYDTSGKIVYDTEFRARTKSGEYRWFKTTGRMTHKKKHHSLFSPFNEWSRKNPMIFP